MHAMSAGMATVSVMFPLVLVAAFSVTVRLVWPDTPSALLVKSMSHVYGPAPSALTCLIVTSTLLPLVTDVTVLSAS